MWICTQDGFLSLSRVPERLDRSQIRARSKRHLINLKATVRGAYGLVDRVVSDEIEESEIIQHPHGDYKYRIIVSPEVIPQILNLYGHLVTYPSFRSSVPESQQSCDDYKLREFLSTVWSLSYSMED